MFLDEKELTLTAGKGGDGVALFRREIYVPRGGPDGGDGGRGGDIILRARENVHALVQYNSIDRIKAEDGMYGGHRQSTGKSGVHTYVDLPLGTEVWDISEETAVKLIDMTQEGQEYIICKGGNGGWGNWHFKSSVNQAPTQFKEGLAGQTKKVKFTLKLIADIGLVGLPNAGKSSFLAAVSRATPKIANYPFTTLEPQLGVAYIDLGKEKVSLVIADIPGIIEGAHEGKGLGIAFLKHIERTKKILHLVDGSLEVEEILHEIKVIKNELKSWSEELAKKAEIIALTKSDLVLDEEMDIKLEMVKKEYKEQVYAISVYNKKSIEPVLLKIAS